MNKELCAAGCGNMPVRKWKNGKKYCNRCLEEIEVMSKERRD